MTDARQITYFLQSSVGGPIKIGKASDPLSRLEEFQCGSPFQLFLLGTTRNHTERELHAKFEQLRERREWFRDSTRLTKWIVKNCKLTDHGKLLLIDEPPRLPIGMIHHRQRIVDYLCDHDFYVPTNRDGDQYQGNAAIKVKVYRQIRRLARFHMDGDLYSGDWTKGISALSDCTVIDMISVNLGRKLVVLRTIPIISHRRRIECDDIEMAGALLEACGWSLYGIVPHNIPLQYPSYWYVDFGKGVQVDIASLPFCPEAAPCIGSE